MLEKLLFKFSLDDLFLLEGKEIKMRCPSCKSKLIYNGHKTYETLSDHVMDPNEEYYCHSFKPTYACPKKCLGEKAFFGYDGGLYSGELRRILPCCFHALDSLGRKIAINTAIQSYIYRNFMNYLRELNSLVIRGENDMPPKWKWPLIWIKSRIKRERQ